MNPDKYTDTNSGKEIHKNMETNFYLIAVPSLFKDTRGREYSVY
jgi:hypothetical protein